MKSCSPPNHLVPKFQNYKNVVPLVRIMFPKQIIEPLFGFFLLGLSIDRDLCEKYLVPPLLF